MRDATDRTSGAAGLAIEALLVLAGLALFGAAAVTLPTGPVRVAVVLIGLLLLPGYALSTLVFPKRVVERPARSRRLGQTDTGSQRGTLTGPQRAGVSVGLSVAALPIFGVAIVAGPVALSVRTVLAVVAAFTVLALALGLARRIRTREESRYVLPLHSLGRAVGAGFEGTSLDVGLNVLLVVVLVVASAGLLGAVAMPQDGTSYTSVSLLTQNAQGELVANGYKTNLSVGESAEYVLEVTNREDESVTYSVVVEQQRVGENGNVVRSAELTRFQQSLGVNDTWRMRHDLQPAFAGENIRYTYLVYRGEAPDDPSVDSAYRHVTLDINVKQS